MTKKSPKQLTKTQQAKLDSFAPTILAELSQWESDGKQIQVFARKRAVHLFTAGKLLQTVKDSLAHGKWLVWLEGHGIPTVTACEAKSLYNRAIKFAGNESKAIAALNDCENITDAKVKFGVVKAKTTAKSTNKTTTATVETVDFQDVVAGLESLIGRLAQLAGLPRGSADAGKVEQLVDKAMIGLITVKAKHGVVIDATNFQPQPVVKGNRKAC